MDNIDNFNNKSFVYIVSFIIYIVVFVSVDIFEIEKRSNQDRINSNSILTLGTPLYYELETTEAYKTGKVYLQNSKDEYKTFYLENDGKSDLYRQVRKFVRSVDDVNSKASLINLLISEGILGFIYLYKFFKDSKTLLEFNISSILLSILLLRIVITGLSIIEEYSYLISNTDLIFKSILVPIS